MDHGSVHEICIWRGIRVLASTCSCLALLLTGEGCWTRSRLDEPTPLNPDQEVWIWSGGKGVQWREVIISRDSVIGIPYHSPRDCEDCRRSISRAEVDSIVVVRPSVAQKVVLYAGSAALFYIIVLLPEPH